MPDGQQKRTVTDVPADRIAFETDILESDGYTVAAPVKQPGGLFTLVGTKNPPAPPLAH
jgi:hypothetical protein